MRFRAALTTILAATLAWVSIATPAQAAAPSLNAAVRPADNNTKPATSFIEVQSLVSDKVTITGKLVSGNNPVGNVELELLIDGAKVGQTSTGTDGSFHGETPTPSPGEHQLTVIFAGNGSYLRASAEGRINVTATIALTAAAESGTAVAGTTVTLSGTAMTKPSNQPVTNARIDTGGGQTTWVVTDDNGAFSVAIPASTNPGPAIYSLTIGDVGGIKGTSAQVSIQIAPRPTPTPSPTTPSPSFSPSLSQTTASDKTASSAPSASASTTSFVPAGPKVADLWPLALLAVLALSSLLIIAAIAALRNRANSKQDTATLSDITSGELDDLT